MGSAANRVKNFVSTPVRGLNTVNHFGIDASEGIEQFAMDMSQIQRNANHELRQLFSEAGTNGKFYHKVLNVPWSVALSGVKGVETAVRSVLFPLAGGIRNTFHGVKGFGVNVFNTLARTFSKKPISDFSFKKLQTKSYVNKGRDLSKLLFGARKKANMRDKTTSDEKIIKMDTDSSQQSANITRDIQRQLQEILTTNKELINQNKALQMRVGNLENQSRNKKSQKKRA